jgi:hypothetical protein
MPWALDCGVVHLGSDAMYGIALRPQMKIGFLGRSTLMEFGIDDVRDGLSAACIAQWHRVYTAEGSSLSEVPPSRPPDALRVHCSIVLLNISFWNIFLAPASACLPVCSCITAS